MTIYLTESDIAGLLDMRITLDVLEETFKAQATGGAVNRSRSRIPLPNGSYNLMAAGLASKRVVGQKSYTATSNGAAFHILLYDGEGKGLLAIVQAGYLGKLRTGAVSGLATRYMAKEGSDSVGVIGAGNQAETQLEAVAVATGITKARVFSRTADRRNDFANRMSEKLGIEVTPVESAAAAVRDAPILLVITNSADPVLSSNHLEPGMHVNAAGNNIWTGSEIDVEAIAKFDTIVVDDVDQAKIESGDLMAAAEVGQFNWGSAIPLCDIVAGKIQGRRSDSEITLFESLGIAIEDIAVAERVYRMAVEQGIGHELPAT